MKLIIDVPEEIYQEATRSGYSHLYDELVADAVSEGTPLDVIVENMRMKKEDILHHFQDINFYYNDCMMYADLNGMLDELISESEEPDGKKA